MVGKQKGGINTASASRKTMTLRIFITPKANTDIDDLFNYIAQNNTDAALHFFDAARSTIANEFLDKFRINYCFISTF